MLQAECLKLKSEVDLVMADLWTAREAAGAAAAEAAAAREQSSVASSTTEQARRRTAELLADAEEARAAAGIAQGNAQVYLERAEAAEASVEAAFKLNQQLQEELDAAHEQLVQQRKDAEKKAFEQSTEAQQLIHALEDELRTTKVQLQQQSGKLFAAVEELAESEHYSRASSDSRENVRSHALKEVNQQKSYK